MINIDLQNYISTAEQYDREMRNGAEKYTSTKTEYIKLMKEDNFQLMHDKLPYITDVVSQVLDLEGKVRVLLQHIDSDINNLSGIKYEIAAQQKIQGVLTQETLNEMTQVKKAIADLRAVKNTAKSVSIMLKTRIKNLNTIIQNARSMMSNRKASI